MFVGSWLDGGLDGGGNLDYSTVWNYKAKTPRKLRIKGTGAPMVHEGGRILIKDLNTGEWKDY